MIHLRVRNRKQDLSLTRGDDTPIEFGRSPSTHNEDEPAERIRVKDDFASRHHVRLDQPAPGAIRLTNLSESKPISLSDGRKLGTRESLSVREPVVSFSFGNTKIDVSQMEGESWATIAAPPGSEERDPENTLEFIAGLDAAPSPDTLRWFQQIIHVQRAAAGSPDFYDKAAKAMVELIGLDEGIVLLLEGKDWKVVGSCTTRHDKELNFSRTILHQVLADRKTRYTSGRLATSLADVSVAAASPILDRNGRSVVGAVYGCKFRETNAEQLAITQIEAGLLQTLAGVISLGIARVEQETEATRLRAQFDQFFTPKLAQALEEDASLLEGQEREISVLFADLRGFTGMSENLEPTDTCQIITEVLECLTATIRDQDGVLVDYAGDGLMAMWGAPTDQPNHAELACETALEMIAKLPEVSRHWEGLIGGPLRVGVGINTGNAVVGNTGTQYKFKYGARGHTVNRASRVEGVTKQLGVPILITESTQKRLGSAFATRRLFQVRMVGVQEAVQLFELHGQEVTDDWQQQRDTYEQALEMFEGERWSNACQHVQPLLQESENGAIDLPSLILATRAIDCLKSRPKPFDPVISLDRK